MELVGTLLAGQERAGKGSDRPLGRQGSGDLPAIDGPCPLACPLRPTECKKELVNLNSGQEDRQEASASTRILQLPSMTAQSCRFARTWTSEECR